MEVFESNIIIQCLTKPFGLDDLILLYVKVELDQYKIFEKYGFIAPTC